MKVMATSTTDQEMNEYFIQLNEAEKKSVVQMIKTFLQSRKESERISLEQYNKEIEEAEAEIERGESYSHEEVVKMSKQWIHGK
jgi:predicted transcriptional regulator